MIKEAAIIIGMPVLRSVGGWAVKALEDNKITTFELKLLASTVIRVGVIGTVTYLGLNGAGVDVSAMGAACGAIVADMLFKALKKNGSKSK